ncbi:MAG: O-antigen ligase family protein [Patescibacteria group bacterium]
MRWLMGLFFLSLLAGPLSGLELIPGVVVYLHDLLLVIIFIATVTKVWKSGALSRSRLAYPIGSFIIASLISLIANSGRFSLSQLAVGSLYLWRWLGYSYLYFLVVIKIQKPIWWLRNLYLVGTGFAILGLFQLWLYPDLRNLYYLGWDPHDRRLFSTLLDPNFMGIILVLTLFLGFWLREVVPQGLNLIALILTYSRSSYLAFFIGLIIWLSFTKRWKVALVSIFLFSALIILLPQGKEGQNLLRWTSSAARLENWQRGVELVKQEPLLGHGFNTLRFIQDKLGGSQEFPSRAGGGIDSSLLFILATTGLLGLGTYSWLIGGMISLGRRLLKRNQTKLLGLTYLISLVAILIHSLFVNSLFYPWVVIWLWIMTAVVESS